MDDPQRSTDEPTPVRSPAPLTRRERRVVAVAATSPIALAALVLLPFAAAVGAGAADVVVGAVIYGGLVGAAAAFVTVDRLHARQCPRCRQRTRAAAGPCPACGYDLDTRPRYACTEGHHVYLDAGLCDCGRRLHQLPSARGVGPQVRFVVRVGAWLLAFLLGLGLILQWLERSG